MRNGQVSRPCLPEDPQPLESGRVQSPCVPDLEIEELELKRRRRRLTAFKVTPISLEEIVEQDGK